MSSSLCQGGKTESNELIVVDMAVEEKKSNMSRILPCQLWSGQVDLCFLFTLSLKLMPIMPTTHTSDKGVLGLWPDFLFTTNHWSTATCLHYDLTYLRSNGLLRADLCKEAGDQSRNREGNRLLMITMAFYDFISDLQSEILDQSTRRSEWQMLLQM